jgi:hypothetical protein
MECEPPAYSNYVEPDDVVVTQNTSTGPPIGFQETKIPNQPQFEQYPPPPPPYFVSSANGNNGSTMIIIDNQPACQQTVITQVPSTRVVYQAVLIADSYRGHRIYACLVAWFCFFIFGIIGWMLARSARTKKAFRMDKEAQTLGRASIGVSTVGLILGIVFWILIIVLFSGGECYNPYNHYYYYCF